MTLVGICNVIPAIASVTITSSQPGTGFVKVDGAIITTPQEFNWIVGSTHTIEALTQVSGAAGTQYKITS